MRLKKYIKDFLIIRTNFFGWGTSYRNSFSDYIIKNLILKKKVYLSDKIKFNPVYLGNLIDCIENLIKRKKGIFNISSNKKISKYNFGIKIAEIFNLDKNYIFIQQENKKIIKPLNMALSNKKIKKVIKKIILI